MAWNRLLWRTPVLVNVPNTSEPEPILTVDQAIEFLLKRWPGRKTNAVWQAVNACSGCIHGQIGPTMAREAFIAAVNDAGIRVEA
ncbi:hypothetical protein C5F48_02640 [Cereibacter changlensis JA139]|uniref:DUF982 domain-containing protein n=2 Tax=Cereibacter changlensis TaxID=402884 RepID=A0A2T4K044_9RHOB|nr:DUF982 domain-containing protein [Cereibacter changlensis]PTE23373.1 hypothetical protein C5F48_02640 [Cereibacter changlensis JA139]PZX48570.1 uncharacterized protein DUF982 [Cereibacter changlensis]